ncbi:MAG: stage V sporulation protein D [Thermanaeromonas sp.]|nr:stage V sporulation protein D [Thermanaeromonas sp.]
MLRLTWLQLVRGGDLQKKALQNRLAVVPVPAQRGIIYDRLRRELAINITSDYIGVFPPEVRDSGRQQEIAAKLAEILGQPQEEILEKITRPTGFEFIARRVDLEKARKIRELKLPGIVVVPENRRYYPNGVLAAHVLGFAGIDNQGLEGLEAMYDKELSGVPGQIAREFDALGREIPQATHHYVPPQNGHSLVLTIDQTLQYIAERELDQLMHSSTKPRKASILIMNPHTGEILALASRPTFDPNRFSESPPEVWGNPVVRDAYEPGSTFKIITAAAALEEGVVKPEDKFYDPGYIQVGQDSIRCWAYPLAHGSQTFAEGVKNSCNPVFVSVALKLEEKRAGSFYDYIQGFGFGSPTGIDLTGEGTGILIPREELKPINIATIGIGQGIAVTPIQLAVAVAAVANGGKIVKPHLVKEILDSEGKVVRRIEPEVQRQIISPATAQVLRQLLEGVVSGGTGRNAYIPGYRVAGKTGTAQKPGPGGYQEGKYVASFIGFAPANDPQILALVIVDEPQGYPYYGGVVAAPIFQRVVADALRYLKIPPQYVETPKEEGEKKSVEVPSLTGLSVQEAKAKLAALGLEARVEGEGGVVVAQIPKEGVMVPQGSKVILFLQGQGEEPRVPDLTGLRIPEAAEVLEALGLKLWPEGSGQAGEQNPVPGTRVPRGTQVKVKFYEPTRPTLGP